MLTLIGDDPKNLDSEEIHLGVINSKEEAFSALNKLKTLEGKILNGVFVEYFIVDEDGYLSLIHI